MSQASRNKPSSQPRGFDPGDDSLLQIIWRQKVVITLAFLLVMGIAAVYFLFAPKEYTAVASVLITHAVPLTDRQAITQDNNSETFLYQEAELMRSVPILSMVIGGPNMDGMKLLDGVDRPLQFLRRELNVEVGRKDGIITVSLSSRFREDATQVVDNVIESYKAFKSKQLRDTASEVMAVLTKDKDKTDDELKSKQEEEIHFKQENYSLSFEGDNSNHTMERANSLNAALTTAHIDAITLKSAADAAMKSIENDPEALKNLDKEGGGILSDEDEKLLSADIFSRKQELAERKRIYLPDHPIIKALEAQINQLNIAYVSSAKLRWQAAVQREQDLQKSYDEQQKLALEMSRKKTEYEQIHNAIQLLQKRSDELTAHINDEALTLDAGAVKITDVNRADWKDQDQPVKPQASHVFGIAAAIGLLFGVLLGVGREWLDPRLRSETEVKTAIGVPVLGAIPHMPTGTSPEVLGWAVHLDPQSEAAEAYRAVRTSVQFGVADGEARTIVVTSPSPRDGKSTLTSNLGIAMAKAGKTVLIIDGDFRSPSQHRIFGVSGEIGFSSVLEAGELLERAIRRTTVEGLHVMPAGPSVRNPSELLNSDALTEILDGLTRQYDHIVIDTAPVARVDDARIVAASCDATVLVLRADKSNRKLAEDARDRLMAVGARVLGVVLNDISGTGGFGGLPGLLRSSSVQENEKQLAADDIIHHTSIRPVTGSGRMM